MTIVLASPQQYENYPCPKEAGGPSVSTEGNEDWYLHPGSSQWHGPPSFITEMLQRSSVRLK